MERLVGRRRCDAPRRRGRVQPHCSLDAGRAYRFRYLLDDQRWENDWAADAYLPNSFGGDDSVVDLTALVQAAPPTAKKASTEKGPTKTTRKGAAATTKPATKPARKTTK
jgi:hypothetical protein